MKRNSNTCERTKIIQRQIQNFEIYEDITNEEIENFRNIYRQLDSNDLGVLLEYLVQVKGPYELAREDVKYSLESKVYHDEIQSNHNFDVIFYLKTSKKDRRTGHIIVDDMAEFHECKNNILNWIPNDKDKILENKNFRKAEAKLNFCKKVHSLFQKGFMYIPTFTYDVRAKQECLNSMGCEFIKILSIKELISVFYKM